MGDPIPADWHADTTLGGLPAMRNAPNEVIVQRDGIWLTIANGIKPEPLTRAELERIYAGITLAAWKAPSSWFDAPQGVGG